MTFEAILGKVKGVMVAGAKKIFDLIIKAPPANIISCGLFVGSIVTSAVILTKSYLTRHKTVDKNMNPVDDALNLNYADRTNRKSLHRRMQSASKPYENHSYKDMVKLYGKKEANRRLQAQINDNISRVRRPAGGMSDETVFKDAEILDALNQFHRDFEEISREDRRSGNRNDILTSILHGNFAVS